MLAEKSSGKIAKLPGAPGAFGTLSQIALLLAKTKSSCDEVDKIVGNCTAFAKNPDYSGCMTCCVGIYQAVPTLSGVAYFACSSICAPFGEK
jgi:hypothetical protein